MFWNVAIGPFLKNILVGGIMSERYSSGDRRGDRNDRNDRGDRGGRGERSDRGDRRYDSSSSGDLRSSLGSSSNSLRSSQQVGVAQISLTTVPRQTYQTNRPLMAAALDASSEIDPRAIKLLQEVAVSVQKADQAEDQAALYTISHVNAQRKVEEADREARQSMRNWKDADFRDRVLQADIDYLRKQAESIQEGFGFPEQAWKLPASQM